MGNNNTPPTVTGVNDLCNSIWKKQIENQMHIPDSVESIEEYAFNGCFELKELTLPPNCKKSNRYFLGFQI